MTPLPLSATIARQPILRRWLALHTAACGVILAAVALVQGGSLTAAGVLLVLLLATSVFALVVPSTTFTLHVAPVILGVDMAVAIVVLAPSGAPAMLAAVYLGVLIPFVTQSRAATAAYLGLTTVMLLAAVAIGGATTTTAIVAITVLPVMWGLGGFVRVVWEQAGEQERELDRLSRLDPLTGLRNRRALDERLTYELARHTETARAMSVVVLDLNGFKAVNDDLGHQAGDDLLCAVADALEGAVRDQDTVGRQGGDEFCVIAPETGPEEARVLTGKIRAALAAVEADGAGIGAALGAATFPDDATGAEALIAVADARQRADKPSPRACDDGDATRWRAAPRRTARGRSRA
ncbi:MAG: GGDEF domain-containing protein [Solirubrobacteraceae bacterium]|nr:GGDEF domain-containing protein [Solirubrobacteraceae bacterium]